MNANVRSTPAPRSRRPATSPQYSNLEPNEILFIDEIHRVNKMIEEILYPALESRKLHLIVGKGPPAKTFSLICRLHGNRRDDAHQSAFRPSARVSAPFSFGLLPARGYRKIVGRSAEILGVKITRELSRSSPRPRASRREQPTAS